MKTFNLHITGKVQGVWYRASAKDEAIKLGLKGKVWNNPDGSVGASIQGSDQQVEAFINWCKSGPILARVKEVITTEGATEIIYKSFDITKH